MQSWKENLDGSAAPNYLCCSSAYVNFVVAILPESDACDRGTCSNDDINPEGDNSETFPSYRAVLVYIDTWILEYATTNDVIIVLSGMTAVTRFTTPGKYFQR